MKMNKPLKIRVIGITVQIVSTMFILILQVFGYVGMEVSIPVVLCGMFFALFMNYYAHHIVTSKILPEIEKNLKEIE